MAPFIARKRLHHVASIRRTSWSAKWSHLKLFHTIPPPGFNDVQYAPNLGLADPGPYKHRTSSHIFYIISRFFSRNHWENQRIISKSKQTIIIVNRGWCWRISPQESPQNSWGHWVNGSTIPIPRRRNRAAPNECNLCSLLILLAPHAHPAQRFSG